MLLFGQETERSPQQISAAGIQYVGLSARATPKTVNHMATAGLCVIPYTVNSAAAARALLSNGAFGVFTDDPWSLSAELRTRV